ncbi:uncharacterized protein LOC131673717 [Phymastichus coffea]|uniref:uncharacterized protein LOC131673717 n=1 Tax=Phymastichus coffea TaxID=108790 RepID=UPI00273AE85D|nr:uncharacterized protein LOC131673717 [Phymastichus coffea]
MRGEAAAVAAAAVAADDKKRSVRSISANDKLEAIQRVREGESKASVARDIGVPESTLRGWCKSEHKIRNMARNASTTPDSDAAPSPASSGGRPASSSGRRPRSARSAHSSEDEYPTSAPKRRRRNEAQPLNLAAGQPSASDVTGAFNASYINLLNSLISSSNSSQAAMLCQQIGALPSTSSMSQQPQQSHHHQQPQAQQHQQLQQQQQHHHQQLLQQQQQQQVSSYVESVSQLNGRSLKRPSTSSAIAPTSVSKSAASRRSLPAAAEAPHASVPLSPRRCEAAAVHQQQPQQPRLYHYNQMPVGANGFFDPNVLTPESLAWILTQLEFACQNRTLNLAETPFWFWELCKNYGAFATVIASRFFFNDTAGLRKLATEQLALRRQSMKKAKNQSQRPSPSQARALVESLVCMNNNELARTSLNLQAAADGVQPAEQRTMSFAEGMHHGRMFAKWLQSYSDPAICASSIVQINVMMNNLERKTEPVPRRERKCIPSPIYK